MARYVTLSLPRDRAEAIRRELASIRSADLQMSDTERAIEVRRLDSVLVGRKRFEPVPVKPHGKGGPRRRIGLDLRRTHREHDCACVACRGRTA